MGLFQDMIEDPITRLAIRQAVTVAAETPVRRAIERMRSSQMGCAMVVDADAKPQGMFTEAMLRVLLFEQQDGLREPIERQMARHFPWVKTNDPIATVLDAMQSKNHRFVCVIDDNQQVAGITDQKALMEYVARHFPRQITAGTDAFAPAAPPMETPSPDDDSLERALADEPVSSMQTTPFRTVPPDRPICQVLEDMVRLEVACLLVAENDRLLGLFSDWDIIEKVALDFDSLRNRPIRDVMTDHPVHVHENDSAAAALSVIALDGFRHVPVLAGDERVVGIVSPQRIASFLQQHLSERG